MRKGTENHREPGTAKMRCAIYGRDYTVALARVSYLAPGIIKAILEGTQPTKLSSTQLARIPNFPYRWDQQAAMLGFA